MIKFIGVIFLAIMVFIGVTIFFIASVILHGWVFSILWEWFIVPYGLPIIDIPHAIAISLIVAFLTHQYIPVKKGDVSNTWLQFTKPLVALLVGWVLKNYFM